MVEHAVPGGSGGAPWGDPPDLRPSAVVAGSSGVVLSPDVPWDPLKNWAIKYLQFTWNVTRLRRCYDGQAAGEDCAELARAALVSCAELADWLVAGPEPRSVAPSDLAALSGAAPLCVAMALTGRGTGRASVVAPRLGTSRRAWVDHQRPGERTTRFDALDLVERCLVTWQGFLGRRGVDLPSWYARS